jgi:hypothetical protein
MTSRTKKPLLLLVAAGLLLVSGQVQKSLNGDRDRLGLTRVATLDNAPPMLAFTTVALGGFRGLISNLLWMRASDLQQDDKFFEAVQLADWITKLEPYYSQVWLFQGWNMAYNISVKFKDFPDRWRWVSRGITLLRDDGLRFNPNDVPIHRELSWFFQHKMGANLDDANLYYKQQWALEMQPFFGDHGTNLEDLVHPPSPEALLRQRDFTNHYKLNPALAQSVDARYGPLDWRLPEAHAIYWAAAGLEAANRHPDKVKPDDLIQLRRSIYQSSLQAFHHGRLIANPFTETYALGPNLELIPKVNDAYEASMAAENDSMREHISTAHRNFLRDAVYFLYENNRVADAAKWFQYLAEKYPDKTIIEKDTNSFPRNVSLDEFAIATAQIDINETSQERVTSAIKGLLTHAYYELAIGQDDRYAGYKLLAAKVFDHYRALARDPRDKNERNSLPPMDTLNRFVLSEMLDPQHGAPFAARAIIRTHLGLPPETNAPAAPVSGAPAAPAPETPAPTATNLPAVNPT